MSLYKVSPISPPMQLGEAPHWIEKDNSLLFVDYSGSTLNRVYIDTGRHQVLGFNATYNDARPSAIIPVGCHESMFLTTIGHDLASVNWSPTDPDFVKKELMPLLSFDQHYPKNSLNDAKCDPQGRLWAGTFGEICGHSRDYLSVEPNKGTLYTIGTDYKISEKAKATISNGLTWSLDAKIFYYIDSLTFSVDAFDYNDHNGEISNRRVVLDLEVANLIDQAADGMTIDNDGNLWVACFNGGKVICIDPKVGKLLRKVDIPSRFTSSCCFGGPDYSTLFVTSGREGLSTQELNTEPDAGKTFAVTGLGSKGSPHQSFMVDKNAFIPKIVQK